MCWLIHNFFIDEMYSEIYNEIYFNGYIYHTNNYIYLLLYCYIHWN